MKTGALVLGIKGGLRMRPGSFNQFKGSRCSPRPAALLVVFFGALALAGCSKDLSRKDLSRNAAAALIEGDESFKSSTFDVKLPVGRFSYWGNANDDFPIKALEAAGILSFKESGESSLWKGLLKYYVVDLTEAGQKEAHSWVKMSEKEIPPGVTVYRIPLARRKLLEVTGIATDAGGKQAHIEYKWKWIPTPQGRLLPDKIPPEVHDGSAIAQLYDDGWRLIRIDAED